MAIDYRNSEVHVAAMSSKEDHDLLDPSEAAAYLATHWGRPFSAKDFMNLRTNHSGKFAEHNIRPAITKITITFWTRPVLDLIIEKIPAPELRGNHGKQAKSRKSNGA